MRRPFLLILLTAGLTALPAVPSMAADSYDFRNLSTPTYTQFVTEEYNVPTEFGTIYGWVRRPVTPAGVGAPVILTYSPYAALASPTPGTDGMNAFYNPRGYARAFFHLVGTGNSGGCTDYGGLRERRTAAAVVDFLGSRPWSNGKVGMIGGSYDGTTQWAAAVEQPEHLATIVPQVAISRWYDYAFGQGVRFYSGNATPLAFDYGFNQAPVPFTDPGKVPVTEKVVDDVRPCDNVDHQVRGYGPDQVHDGWWGERDYRARADRVRVPALIEGSWSDYNVHPLNSTEMWQLIAPRDERHRLVMGLQGHGVPNHIPTAALHHAWFDRHLLGRDTNVESVPRVQSDLSGGGEADDPSWPPPATLHRYTLDTEEGAGLLTGSKTSWRDINPLLDEDDVMVNRGGDAAILFRSRPEPAAVRLVGRPRLDLRIVTDAEETQVTPVLFAEKPSGQRTIISRGLLNALNRDGIDRIAPLAPGTAWEGTVEFQPLDHLLLEDERLGVALMSMNTDEALHADKSRATNTLVLGDRTALELLRAPAPPEG